MSAVRATTYGKLLLDRPSSSTNSIRAIRNYSLSRSPTSTSVLFSNTNYNNRKTQYTSNATGAVVITASRNLSMPSWVPYFGAKTRYMFKARFV